MHVLLQFCSLLLLDEKEEMKARLDSTELRLGTVVRLEERVQQLNEQNRKLTGDHLSFKGCLAYFNFITVYHNCSFKEIPVC